MNIAFKNPLGFEKTAFALVTSAAAIRYY